MTLVIVLLMRIVVMVMMVMFFVVMVMMVVLFVVVVARDLTVLDHDAPDAIEPDAFQEAVQPGQRDGAVFPIPEFSKKSQKSIFKLFYQSY